jgi:hypothetical protein
MLGALAVQRVPWKNLVVAAEDCGFSEQGTGYGLSTIENWLHIATSPRPGAEESILVGK